MNLSWYVCNVRHDGDEKNLRSRVRMCVRRMNEHCLRFVCYPNGETKATLQERPPYRENDLGMTLNIRNVSELFAVVYRQLLYLQRKGLFEVTPASMDVIDVMLVDGHTFLLGVPVIRHEISHSLEEQFQHLLPVRLGGISSTGQTQALLRDYPKYH